MESELKNIIKVWVSGFASLSYCYLIARRIPKGKFRLLSIIPIFCLFLLLPLIFSTMHFRGYTGFSLAWLANLKLLLFAFGQGPLSLDPSMPFLHFIAVGCLPIKINYQSRHGSSTANENPSPLPKLPYPIKVVLLPVVIRLYDYRQNLHQQFVMLLCCSYTYFGAEIILGTVAYLVSLVIGLELEPTFKEPHLSTSLQDFWSRRWNIMVPKILHPTIYEPTRCLAVQLLGNEFESVPRVVAILNTFFVSGLLHELLFFYMGYWQPTWKTMYFFALQGVCLAAEVVVKKELATRRWQLRLHPAVSWSLVNGFLFITISWLLVSDIIQRQLDIMAISEYKALEGFIKDLSGFGA
ncbi:probable long-chain-alcohol O-fatty-acyltransferase 5 [Macadamia integrifolia]|uniref:probable long-chain-alcohol O-fatty-acyltransferase 5 n=1 Tax=Macadamia integrifolia TaxID=60698 RepID=UPI001C533195|nr:probable long-chain-alcohol O-fatty-acyltransferase 5 [Macadamia integrifolia]